MKKLTLSILLACAGCVSQAPAQPVDAGCDCDKPAVAAAVASSASTTVEVAPTASAAPVADAAPAAVVKPAASADAAKK